MEKKKEKLKTIDLVYIGVSVALIAICSWISIPLAVPITLQTLAICLVSGLFTFKRGGLAIIIYILLGAIGIPVFSGFKGGIGILFGPTGGYILGFILTALIVGITANKTKKLWALALSMAAGIIVCYAFGTLWFALFYADGKSVLEILSLCVFPFILPDIIKILISAFLIIKLKRFIK